ncbi:hypothetical protein HK101_007317 [Irineochytrium annulatum]|nr:hypothetical protein HK101_007317 [Irineochytrium annulatum]
MALFVGRLPTEVKVADLEDIFAKYGRISRLDIKRGASFNFGFVEYEDKRDAEDALKECDGKNLQNFGTRLVVEWSKGGSRRSESNECFKVGVGAVLAAYHFVDVRDTGRGTAARVEAGRVEAATVAAAEAGVAGTAAARLRAEGETSPFLVPNDGFFLRRELPLPGRRLELYFTYREVPLLPVVIARLG